MMTLIVACALVLAPGDVVTMSELAAEPEQAALENVALCFFDAVGFLQETPEVPGDFALLLAEAKEILDGMGIRLGQGDFSVLQWSEDMLSILTPSGLPIICTVAGEEHESTDEGSSYFVTYEFSVQGDSISATAVIELQV